MIRKAVQSKSLRALTERLDSAERRADAFEAVLADLRESWSNRASALRRMALFQPAEVADLARMDFDMVLECKMEPGLHCDAAAFTGELGRVLHRYRPGEPRKKKKP